MKNLILFVVFILALVLVQFAQGQTVDEIIDKHIAARGGKDNINSIKTIIMEGSKQMMGGDVMIKITKVQDKLYRTDFEFGGNPGYMIITPEKGWSFIPMRSTKPDEIPQERLKLSQTELDIAGPLVNYAAKGHKAELQGKEMVNDINTHKVKLTLNTGRVITYFIDAKTYLIVQTRSTAENQKGEKTEQVTDYGDWKEVNKVMFPHSLTVQGTGMNAGTTIFDKIETNKEVSEKYYQPQ